MSESKAVQKFNEKLEALEKDTGLTFELLPELIADHVDTNRLYAGWFAPNTVLATATDGKDTIKYEVIGGVDATLLSPSGDSVHTFLGKFAPFENDDITIANDKDIDALTDGKHESGYTLLINANNKVRVSAEGIDAIEPAMPTDLSVARNLLNAEIARELKKAIFNYVKPEDRLTEQKKINDRLDALAEAASELEDAGFEDMPDRQLDPDDEEDKPFETDIPEYSETEEGKAFLEKHMEEIDKGDEEASLPEPTKKEEKKTSKKAPSKTKQTKAKKTAASKTKKDEALVSDEESIPRYDLLPLDFISTFINEFSQNYKEVGFLSMIELYKSEDCSLLDAAVMYAKANYADAAEAVTALAREFEADAEANGEDAWKEKDALRYINEAIQDHLFGSDNEEKAGSTLRRLVCAAWVDANA